MKKTIIITTLALAVFITGTAFAQVSSYNWKGDLPFTRITNRLIDEAQVINYKFEDKLGTSTVTCYGSYVTHKQSLPSVAISCVK